MTEFITYSGLSAAELNDKFISLLRNIRQQLIETSLCVYPDDSKEIVTIKEELVSILGGFTTFFSNFEFNVYNAADLINLLIVNAKRVEFTDDEVANKDKVFGVLLVFVHFQDGILRLRKANECRLSSHSEGSDWLPSVLVLSSVAVVCFLAGGFTQSVRPSFFQGILGSLARRK